MTKEVAIRNLEMIRIAFVNPATKEQRKLINDTVEMAISALSEKKGDFISRQAVEEMIKAEMPERGMWEIEGDKEKETVCVVCVDLMQKLSELPSVENCAYLEENQWWIFGAYFQKVPLEVIAWQPLPEPYKPEKGGEE